MENENYIDFTIEETIYKTQLTKKFLNRKAWQEPNPKEVYSYIPGTVTEVFVNQGDNVEEGQVILIIEAMKMYNKISCPFDGKLKSLNVKVGDKIPKGFLIFELE